MAISLGHLLNSTVQVLENSDYPNQSGEASVVIVFSEGSKLRADYWRLIKAGRAGISSFDHLQKYGLPASIDAIVELKNALASQRLLEASHEESTGDLHFSFSNEVELQVLNFTGYEVWEMSFRNGTVEYSNYAK